MLPALTQLHLIFSRSTACCTR